MSLLKLCRVLLTNDSGPMHVAAALGTPVVVPFGSTSPELTGPGLPGDPRHRLLKSDAPCSPCFRRECPIDFRCMNGISVERVVEAVVEVLKAKRVATTCRLKRRWNSSVPIGMALQFGFKKIPLDTPAQLSYCSMTVKEHHDFSD